MGALCLAREPTIGKHLECISKSGDVRYYFFIRAVEGNLTITWPSTSTSGPQDSGNYFSSRFRDCAPVSAPGTCPALPPAPSFILFQKDEPPSTPRYYPADNLTAPIFSMKLATLQHCGVQITSASIR